MLKKDVPVVSQRIPCVVPVHPSFSYSLNCKYLQIYSRSRSIRDPEVLVLYTVEVQTELLIHNRYIQFCVYPNEHRLPYPKTDQKNLFIFHNISYRFVIWAVVCQGIGYCMA